MFRSRVFAAALCAMLLPAALFAQTTGDILPFKAVEKTLPNGLKVIVVPTGFPNIVSLQIPVQTGSRNEVEPGKSGFAHLFEHLALEQTGVAILVVHALALVGGDAARLFSICAAAPAGAALT